MADIRITDLVDPKALEQLETLSKKLDALKVNYTAIATDLAKGLQVNVQVSGDLDKLNTLVATKAKEANTATAQLNQVIKEQSTIIQQVSKSLEEQAAKGNLTTKQANEMSNAITKSSTALQKLAKADATVASTMDKANKSRKQGTMTEQERIKVINEAIAVSKRQVHSIQEAQNANKQLRNAVKLLKDTDQDYLRTLGQLNSQIGINTDYIQRNSDRYTQQKMNIGNYTESIKAAFYQLKQGNNTFKNFGIIAGSTAKILNGNLKMGFSSLSSSVGVLMKGIIGANVAMAAFKAVVGVLRNAFNTLKEFEAANSKLEAVSGATSDQMEKLELNAKKLGSTTRYTASEVTNLQIELAKLGYAQEDITNMTDGVLKFAMATGAELPEAASLTGAALRMFGATTQETTRYVSAMAVATSRSALSFSYLQTALPIVGPVAKAFNFTIEDTVALLGKLADAGFDASSSATATRNLLLNLANANGKLAKAIGEPVKNLDDMVKALKDLNAKGVDLNTTLELTDKRSVAAFNAFLNSADGITKLRDQVTGVDGDLNNMADTMANNVQGSLAGLSSAWEGLMLTFENSKGLIKEMIDWLAGVIRKLSDLMTSYNDLRKMAVNDAKVKLTPQIDTYRSEREDEIDKLTKYYQKNGMKKADALAKARGQVIARVKEDLRKDKIALYKIQDEVHKEASSWSNFFLTKDKELAQKEAPYNAKVEGMEGVLTSLSGYSPGEKTAKGGGEKVGGNSGKATAASKKAAQEELKVLQNLQDAKIELMDEGIDKEVAKIKQEYMKKIAAVKGTSSQEQELRVALGLAMNREVADKVQEWQDNVDKADIANRLASIKKGSYEELALKLEQMEIQEREEIKKAKETGQNIALVRQKYEYQRDVMTSEFDMKKAQEELAVTTATRNAQYAEDLANLEKYYAEQLKATKANSKERMAVEKEYQDQKYALEQRYTKDSLNDAVKSIEIQLEDATLSEDKKEKLRQDLAKAKEDIAKKEADMEIANIKRTEKAEEDSRQKRIQALHEWASLAQQAISNITGLASAMYQGSIENIEEQQDANQDAYDEETERIDALREQKIISEEEAEARKRAAQERTQQKEKELDKKKAELKRKQALWDKANSIAQIGIATALAITQALPNVVLAAIVGALGAIQLATAIATPIPKYAKGTDNHIGGLALVGDGGKAELVQFGGKMWVTPDKPTLVNMPKGATVEPDAQEYLLSRSINFGATDKPTVVVNNDYKSLESAVGVTNKLLKRQITDNRKALNKTEYDLYVKSRL